jgi:CRP/FNR family transcriptional regulator
MSDPHVTVERFFKSYSLRRYRKGQVLLLDGEGPERVFYLKSGRVKVYDISYRGDEIILNVFSPGTFFPVALVVNRAANKYVYEAETNIEVHQAPAKEVVAFIKDNPPVAYEMLAEVYSKMDEVFGRVSHLMASSAKRRLIYELLLECRHFGHKEEDGTILLSITEKEIGARAGLSRETVSREIGKLKRDKLVQVQSNALAILNRAELEWRLNHVA